MWDFVVTEMELFSGRSAGMALRLGFDIVGGDLPPPWEHLEGFAHGDNGRTYGWEIEILSQYEDAEWLGEEWPAPLRPLPLLPPIKTPLLFAGLGKRPVIVVDHTEFGQEVLDAIRYSPPELRHLLFQPCLTDEEDSWVQSIDLAGRDAQIVLALDTLTARFGTPLRVESGLAEIAAVSLAEAGFVLPLNELFALERSYFSATARRKMRAWWDEHQRHL